MRLSFFTENFRLKLFSVVVGVMMFLFVNVESNTPVEVDFNVVYRTADDIVLISEPPSRVSVTLRGPWANFRSLMVGQLEPVVVDLSETGPGTKVLRIEPSDVDPPTGMNAIAVAPSEVEVTLDRLIEKQVPVEVDFLGRPAFGYEIQEVEVKPPRVRVRGPRNRMKTLDFVYTRAIDLAEQNEDLEREVDLRPPAPSLRLVDRPTVEVRVDLREEVLERRLELPVQLVGGVEGSQVAPDVVSVTLKGPRRIVDRLTPEDLQAVVDVEAETSRGLRVFDKTVELKPELPERTQVIGTLPVVKVTTSRRRRRKG